MKGNTKINGDLNLNGDLVVNSVNGRCFRMDDEIGSEIDSGSKDGIKTTCLNKQDVEYLALSDQYSTKSRIMKSACMSKEGVHRMDVDVSKFDTVPLDDDMLCISKNQTSPVIDTWINSKEDTSNTNSMVTFDTGNTNTFEFAGCSKNDIQFLKQYKYKGKYYNDVEEVRNMFLQDECEDEYESCKTSGTKVNLVTRIINTRASPQCNFQDIETSIHADKSESVLCPSTDKCNRDCIGFFVKGKCFHFNPSPNDDYKGMRKQNSHREMRVVSSDTGLYLEDNRDRSLSMKSSPKTLCLEYVGNDDYMILDGDKKFLAFDESIHRLADNTNIVHIYFHDNKHSSDSDLCIIKNSSGWLTEDGESESLLSTSQEPITMWRFIYKHHFVSKGKKSD